MCVCALECSLLCYLLFLLLSLLSLWLLSLYIYIIHCPYPWDVKQRSIFTAAKSRGQKRPGTRLGSALRLIRVESTTGSWSANGTVQSPVVRFTCHTLQGINISHPWEKENHLQKWFLMGYVSSLKGNPYRPIAKSSPLYVVETTMSVLFFWSAQNL